METSSSILDVRRAGILLHITSLPDTHGNGDLGDAAFRFVEFLAAAGISVWQTLPLGPTHLDGSPYQCLSVHAGNPLLINIEWLERKGWLKKPKKPAAWISSADYRSACLRQAFEGFRQSGDALAQEQFKTFCGAHASWLDDYALFIALRQEYYGLPWQGWPEGLRDRQPEAMRAACSRYDNRIERIKFEQFIFFSQWQELRAFAHKHGILLFGDMPIFVSGDSAEVWACRDYFAVDAEGQATVVAGVPPDYFSATGQLWGNPHYNWERMEADGFSWWIDRLKTQLELFDWVRIDHFRGFEAYWEIPADAETAIHGRWVKAPGEQLLTAVGQAFDALPLVAEDLGIITPEVEALRDQFHLPGMKILQFAFDGGPDNIYLPHHHQVNSVVYTGTHDNDTTLSWYQSLSDEQRAYVDDYLGYPQTPMPWALLRCALESVARLVIVPMQDVLGLGKGDRMNTPGTIEGNWQWRFSWDQLNNHVAGDLRHLIELYGRRADPE